jgi:hypothetical protein
LVTFDLSLIIPRAVSNLTTRQHVQAQCYPDDLIEDIEKDKQVGARSLERPHYTQFRTAAFLNQMH